MVSEVNGIDLGIERAVNTVLDLNFAVARFDVYIGGARLHGVIDDRINQLDDGGHL
jgi:hypothetical protein